MATATATKKAAPTKATAKTGTAKRTAPTKASPSVAPPKVKKEPAAPKEPKEPKELYDKALGAQLVRLKDDEGKTWTEICEIVSKPLSAVNVLNLIYRRTLLDANGGPKAATPALIAKARDDDKMSWDEIVVAYGLSSKGKAQNLYNEATGNDPHSTYVGKGGRYFGFEEKIAPMRAEKASKTASEKQAKGKTRRNTGPAIDLEASNADLLAALQGKKITFTRQTDGASEQTPVLGKPTIGKTKDGSRAISFNDGTKARTVRLDAIAKVS